MFCIHPYGREAGDPQCGVRKGVCPFAGSGGRICSDKGSALPCKVSSDRMGTVSIAGYDKGITRTLWNFTRCNGNGAMGLLINI